MSAELEKLREALDSGDTIAISRAMPWGMQTYQMAKAALEGHRSRDAEVAELIEDRDKAVRGIDTWVETHGYRLDDIQALQADKAELVNVLLRLAVNIDTDIGPCCLDHHGFCQEHFCEKPCIMEAVRALLAKHGKGAA